MCVVLTNESLLVDQVEILLSRRIDGVIKHSLGLREFEVFNRNLISFDCKRDKSPRRGDPHVFGWQFNDALPVTS